MLISIKTLLGAPYNKKHVGFALYRFFQWKFIRFFKPKEVRLNIWGDRQVLLYPDSIQSMWFMYNYWVDWEEFNLIKDIIRQDDILLDIGANIGFYTLWMSRFIGKGSVHSFEPDEKNFQRLDRNINLNGLGSVIKANKTAVSEKTGTLFLTQDRDTMNHLTYEKTTGAVSISTITLDEYCQANNINRIKYLKIDIEGFEMTAFKGGEQLLRNGAIGIIQLEINNALNNSGITEEQLVSYLAGFGYQLATYDIPAKKIKRIGLSRQRENYFAIKDTPWIREQLTASGIQLEK